MRSLVTTRAGVVARHAADDQPGLAALELARFAYPNLNLREQVARLDELADAVEGETHLDLRRAISISAGIGGNVDDYFAVDNSFLNRVLDTRRGIPISLSVLWIEVGRRAGIEVQGVGLPGHFLVYAGGQLVDPFHYGEAIGWDEAAGLVANALGGAPRLDKSWLEPVGTMEIVARMCRNLQQIYATDDDHASLEWVDAVAAALASTAIA